MIRVSDLETMDRAALIAAWAEVFAAPAPKGISRSFLRRFLAIEIQTRRSGSLPKAFAKQLAGKPRQTTGGARSRTLQPGGRLLREWNGVTHVVEVTEAGFRWNDQSWRSLSAIAREITGAHWSGPRFFGLTGKANQ